VININEGRNEAIVQRCRKLAEYATFTARIRSYQSEGNPLEEAAEKAIKYCSKRGILEEFLEIYGSEVLSMILMEWNTEDAIAYAREEGREDGLVEGREQGLEIGLAEASHTIARNLLAKGLTPELVQETTGLSLEEIEKLL